MDERSFTFFLEDAAGFAATFEVAYCVDERAAKAKAQAILNERPRYVAVEVSDGLNQFRVEQRAA